MPIALTPEALAHASLEVGAIKLQPSTPFTWASGLRMPIYNDNRMHISHPDNRTLIHLLAVQEIVNEELFEDGTDNYSFNAILAIPSGGIWLAALLAATFRMPLIVPDGHHYLVLTLEKQKKQTAELKFDAVVASYPRMLPFAVLYADANRIPLLYLRPAPKSHGVGKQVEGDVEGISSVYLRTHWGDIDEDVAKKAVGDAGLSLFANYASEEILASSYTNLMGFTCLAVEDLISTGKSSLEEIRKAQDAEAVITDCLSIFSYEMQSAINAFADAKVRKIPLLTYPTLIEQAVREGYVNEEDRLLLLDWQTDPEGWGARNGFPKIEKQTI